MLTYCPVKVAMVTGVTASRMAVSTNLQLRVTRFRLACSSGQKGQHGLSHLRHAGNQLGFSGVWVLLFRQNFYSANLHSN